MKKKHPKKLKSSDLAIAKISRWAEAIETDFQKALDAGATEFEPVKEKPWGQKVGYVRDNNGFLIEICTPIKDNFGWFLGDYFFD